MGQGNHEGFEEEGRRQRPCKARYGMEVVLKVVEIEREQQRATLMSGMNGLQGDREGGGGGQGGSSGFISVIHILEQ